MTTTEKKPNVYRAEGLDNNYCDREWLWTLSKARMPDGSRLESATLCLGMALLAFRTPGDNAVDHSPYLMAKAIGLEQGRTRVSTEAEVNRHLQILEDARVLHRHPTDTTEDGYSIYFFAAPDGSPEEADTAEEHTNA